MITLNQIPPMDEVWLVAGTYYLVRYVDNTQPPIPLIWEVRGDDVEALGITKANKTFSPAEVAKAGALSMGTSRELWNTTEDPVDQINSNFETEAKVKPWLRDPEILALWTGAALEGRSITDAELQGTEWWRSHTDTELHWLSLNASDPATAAALIADNRAQVTQLLQNAGIDNASADLANTLADSWTTGSWTQSYVTNQIRLLADPNLQGDLDPLLQTFRTGDLDTTSQGEDTVRNLLNTWLGPAYAANWSEETISKWATQLRENPDAQMELENVLRQHRLALFPEYTDANLSYEDIAAPWRGLVFQEWGQVPDETDPRFVKIVRMNDLAGAQSLLRSEGLKQGNQKVSNQLLSDLSVFGGQVRHADQAIL